MRDNKDQRNQPIKLIYQAINNKLEVVIQIINQFKVQTKANLLKNNNYKFIKLRNQMILFLVIITQRQLKLLNLRISKASRSLHNTIQDTKPIIKEIKALFWINNLPQKKHSNHLNKPNTMDKTINRHLLNKVSLLRI